MIRKNWKYILLVCSVFVLSGLNVAFAYDNSNHPVRIIASRYRTMPYEVFITPYEVGLYALDDLDNTDHRKDVKAFLEWYLKRINNNDKNGMSGTIYDVILYGDKEKVLPQYDSIDGYSGLFLVLLNKYCEQTGDISLIKKYWQQIEDMAYTISYLQQVDGLTIAMPDYPVKYLMDNCEAYGGINSFLYLAQKADKKINYEYYQNIADNIKNAIFNVLLNTSTGDFSWSDEADGRISNWGIFYPDSSAQIFLIYYDVLDEYGKSVIWDKFLERYPSVTWKNLPSEQAVFCRLVKKKMGMDAK